MNSNPIFAAMDNAWVPGLILAHLYVLNFVVLWFSSRLLPARPTTKFGLLGQPASQMSRRAYVIFMTVFSLCMPLLCLVLMAVVGAKPENVHIPNHAYWFSPAHVAETRAYFVSHSLWFACLTLGFLLCIHLLVVRANRRQPPRLPWLLFVIMLVCFFGGILWWGTDLDRHFRYIPQQGGAPTSVGLNHRIAGAFKPTSVGAPPCCGMCLKCRSRSVPHQRIPPRKHTNNGTNSSQGSRGGCRWFARTTSK